MMLLMNRLQAFYAEKHDKMNKSHRSNHQHFEDLPRGGTTLKSVGTTHVSHGDLVRSLATMLYMLVIYRLEWCTSLLRFLSGSELSLSWEV